MLLGATWGGTQFPLSPASVHPPLSGLLCSEHAPASSADILNTSHESQLGQVQGITQHSSSSEARGRAGGAELGTRIASEYNHFHRLSPDPEALYQTPLSSPPTRKPGHT